MTSGGLCDFCSALDFTAPGYYYFALREAPTFSYRRRVRDILQCSTTCVFCRKIAEFCYRWRSRKFGDFASLNFEETTADIFTTQYGSSERDVDDSPLASLTYLSASVTVKKPDPFSGYCGGTVNFQKVGSNLGSVSDFIDTAVRPQDAEPYTARLRPLLADLRLFRKWKQICHDEHGDLCVGKEDATDLALRLIDVVECQILDGGRNLPFVALSYVWGQDTIPCLTQATMKSFRRKGSLNQGTVPATIWDAIVVTRALGERFLWVDSCCIVQDDETDKLKYIPFMSLIYGLASVTIVATSGISADAGLPGVRPGSRSRLQEPFTASGCRLMEKLEPYGNGDTLSYIGESAWNERGWVYSERLLSCRALVFTDEQVSWECSTAYWSEDSCQEFEELPVIHRHCIEDDFPPRPLMGYLNEFDREYRLFVEKYSERKFSLEGDYLHGFSGILQAFQRTYKESFVWGLPVSYFSSALSWPTENMPPPPLLAERRLAAHSFKSVKGPVRHCPFPSWSWLGWKCRVYLAQCSDELQPNATGLAFHTIGENGRFQLIQELKALDFEGTTRNREWKGTKTKPLHANLPPKLLQKSIERNVAALCFWSSVSAFEFHSGEQIQSLRHRAFYGKRTGAQEVYDFPIEANWKHLPALPLTNRIYGAVVVGDTDTWGGRRENLNVMLVSWDGEGVGYRVGMLSMLEEDWMGLQREWKQVTLC